MWRAKPEIGWQFKWISSGRSRGPTSPAPGRIGALGLLYLPARARARNDPFPREALLFYEGVKEARALPSPQPDADRVSKRPYLRYTKPRSIYFRSLVVSKTGGQSALCSRPLCQLVTWAPCRREKNERRGAPLGIASRSFSPREVSILRSATFRSSRRLTSPP